MTLISLNFYYGLINMFLTNSLCNFTLVIILLLLNVRFNSNSFNLVILVLMLSPISGFLPGLANSLSNIHPPLLLMSFMLMFSNTHKLIKFKLVFLIFSLFLGGWWASQEYNWGGWWNWDTIETPILLYIVYYVYVKHVSFLSKVTNLLTKTTLTFLLKLSLLIYLNTRFLDTSSIHSFTSINKVLLETSVLWVYFNSFYFTLWWVLIVLVKIKSYKILGIFGFYITSLLFKNRILILFKTSFWHTLIMVVLAHTLVFSNNLSPINLYYIDNFKISISCSSISSECNFFYTHLESFFNWRKKINLFLK